MKPVGQVTACLVDYGTFTSLAEKLAETMKQVYYYSPIEREYQDIRDCARGIGLDNVERLDEPLDPKVLKDIDLFVFPDIGYGGLQRHLRSLGKAVWGHLGADDLELYRTYFLDVLKAVKLPVIHSHKCVGLSALAQYLREHENKWVKLDRYRENCETWKHYNYAQSIRTLDSLAVTFGGAKEMIDFIVQDEIETDLEFGYDGWNIDGKFPACSFSGLEKKNELYLGSVLSAAELPDEISVVNEAMAPVLKKYGYRNFWATEIRIKDGIPYFIDPTPRLPGQTGEHQMETISNQPDIIWQGANGVLLEAEFEWQFAAEATLHYDAAASDTAVSKEWKSLDIPKLAQRWFKPYHYCKIDGVYHFIPSKKDEVGVVLGVGDSCEESIKHLQENLEMLKELPVHANIAGFASLLESIKEAEKHGMRFGGKIPTPEKIFKKAANL